jgi:hypothetical protein
MSERNEQDDPPASGSDDPGVEDDVASRGDEGARSASATPPIPDDAKAGQTQTPAPPDDVGVPSDDEIAREEEEAREED